MHPPRGSRQSKYRSAVAQKGPARHLTCRRAPGAGLSHSCQIGRRVKLYGLLPSQALGDRARNRPPWLPRRELEQEGLRAANAPELSTGSAPLLAPSAPSR